MIMEAVKTAAGGLIGDSPQRVEDDRLLRGRGRFTDDMPARGALHAAFVRSEVAHGRLRGVDTAQALEIPGVVAILHAGDLRPHIGPVRATCNLDMGFVDMFGLAVDKVRYVGEPIAIVLAHDRYVAEDGAELVAVDIEPLPAVVSVADSAAVAGEPIHREMPDNVWARLDAETGDVALASSQPGVRTLTFTAEHRRVTPLPLEPRAIIADVGPGTSRPEVWVTGQAPHWLRTGFAQALGLDEADLRVICPDVGGGFGAKLPIYQEYLAALGASRLLDRAVRWTADRREEMLTTTQAREQTHEATVAYDATGRIVALKTVIVADAGSYGVWPQTAALEGVDATEPATGCYDIRNYAFDVTIVASNKAQMGAYRGIGRPMACFVIERAIEKIAAELDIDRLELRRHNLVHEFPYETAGGTNLDSGDFEQLIDVMQETLGYDELCADLRRRRDEGQLVGLGFALAIEPSAPSVMGMGGFGPRVMTGYETATLRVEPDGTVLCFVGTHSHGQGHETTMAQIAADELGVLPAQVRVRFGDTAEMAYGGGTWASRSTVLAGGAIAKAAADLRAKITLVGAHLLRLDGADVSFERGAVHGPGDELVPLADVARVALQDTHLLPPDVEPGLEATRRQSSPKHAVSSRLHAAVVEVDRDTGNVTLLRYVAVEDCGPVINPAIVAGQIRGGVVQGLGQALLEEFVYDEGGQPLTTSLLDYAVPTADYLCDIEVLRIETPSPRTWRGVKGVGEGGVIPPPAVDRKSVV